MANLANTAAGRSTAEALVKTRMDAGTWIVGFWAIDVSGNTVVRFQRPMSPTNPGYGEWVESRDDAIS